MISGDKNWRQNSVNVVKIKIMTKCNNTLKYKLLIKYLKNTNKHTNKTQKLFLFPSFPWTFTEKERERATKKGIYDKIKYVWIKKFTPAKKTL